MPKLETSMDTVSIRPYPSASGLALTQPCTFLCILTLNYKTYTTYFQDPQLDSSLVQPDSDSTKRVVAQFSPRRSCKMLNKVYRCFLQLIVCTHEDHLALVM